MNQRFLTHCKRNWGAFVLIPLAVMVIAAFGAFASHPAFVTLSDGTSIPIAIAATLGATMPTMADFAKLLGPNDQIARTIEMLNQSNEILDDMVWQEGNTTTGWMGNVRTGLPSVVFRLVNQGVPPSKATTAQLTEQAARMEGWVEVDEALAELASDLGEFRNSQAFPMMESFNQTLASKLFYGNYGLAPEEFTGLATRFSTSVTANAANGANIIKAGGAGADNMSIWLINWHPATVFGIYPKGTQAGLVRNDLGLETVEATNGIAGNRLRAYREQFVWRCGIAVPDWRSVVRIANISQAGLLADTAGASVKLIEYMSRAIDRIQGPRGRLVFYAPRTAKSILRVQALNKSTNALGIEEGLNQFGQQRPGGTVTFLGIPVRTVDALLNTEATVP
jgi:hypothetical protein